MTAYAAATVAVMFALLFIMGLVLDALMLVGV